MITAIAIDDEPLALKVIRALCDSNPSIHLQKTFTQPSEALKHLRKFPTDLIFCDIQMPTMTGINLVRALQQNTMVIKHCLVKIENSQIFEHRLIDLCKVLKDYFLQHPLDEQDELYIYYWSDIEIGMWRVKKKGRLNAKWERNDLLCIDDSLGSRLGIITNDISH